MVESADPRAIRWRKSHMLPRLPTTLLTKVGQACDPCSRPARVNLVLESGRIIRDVFLGKGGDIAMVGGRLIFREADLRFKLREVVDLRPCLVRACAKGIAGDGQNAPGHVK